MKRALVIEKLPCHHELIPTWVWLLIELGYKVDVLARAPPHRDITKYMSTIMGLQFRLVNSANMTDYALVINNSVYTADSKMKTRLYKGQNITLSVLHALPAAGSSEYPDECRLNNHYTVALGPHLEEAMLSARVPNIRLPPIFFGPIPEGIKKIKDTFIVQGVLERFRRNYDVIPTLVNDIQSQTYEFKITLLGDSLNDDTSLLESLREKIVNEKLRETLQCKQNLTYDHFLLGIRSSGWVMPLVDNTFSHGYFTQKITSSVMLAIGNETPLLLHSRLANIYSLTDGENCLTYDDNGEQKAFVRALRMTSDEYQRIRANVSRLRNEWLENSLNQARACNI